MSLVKEQLHTIEEKERALEVKRATMPYWQKPNHADADPDNIAERMERRAYRNERRDELHLGRGLHSRRLKYLKGNGERERAFARHWMKRRECLGHLLRPYPPANVKFKDMTQRELDEFHSPVFVTKRDSEVASTIIQWLGSNVGFCFLEQVLRSLGYKLVKDT